MIEACCIIGGFVGFWVSIRWYKVERKRIFENDRSAYGALPIAYILWMFPVCVLGGVVTGGTLALFYQILAG